MGIKFGFYTLQPFTPIHTGEGEPAAPPTELLNWADGVWAAGVWATGVWEPAP